MKERFSSTLGMGLRLSSWPAALIGIVLLRAVLLLATKPGSWVGSLSTILYFLLLVSATGVAIRNGIQNTLGSRPFWVFLAIAYGLWGLDQWLYVYYGLVLRSDVPDNSIADPVLFLHIVPLTAAVATLPHRNVNDRKVYPATLNFLLLLFLWSFLYGYAVFPYEYFFPNATSYALRFDVLYLLENLALVLAVGFLTLRAANPWKTVYRNLFGACALYVVSSTVANIAIDSGGYVNGKLYGLGLTASVCWFVWIPVRARRLTMAEVEAGGAEDSPDSRASMWAMAAVVLISIPIVWELFQKSENPGMRALRLVVAVVTVVGLASAAFVKEYLAKRDLAARVGLAHDRLRLAMEASKSVGWDWDVRSGRDTWFGDLKTMFGIPSDTYTGHVEDFRRRIHPEDRTRVWKAVNDAKRSHEPYDTECRIVWPDGSERWVSAQGRFYYSEDGFAERMLGMAVDITERKLSERALRESEDKYRDLVEHSHDLLCTHDLAGNLLSCNPAPAHILGYEVAEMLKIPMRELVAPEFREQFEAYLARIRTVGVDKGALVVVARSGERRIWEYHNTLRTEGVASPIVRGMAHDITERKRAEKSLKLFRVLIDQSNDAIEVIDPETLGFIDFNERACWELGYTREELLSLTVLDVDPTVDKSSHVKIVEHLRNSGFAIFESLHRRKDGSTFPVEVSVKQVKLDRLYMVTVSRDISERKQTEAALQEAQAELARVSRIATMGELTASIAHEINQPLTAVVTDGSAALHWLAIEPPNLEEAKEALSRTVREANRAGDVIRRTRALMSKVLPKLESLDVNAVIREVLVLTSGELARGGVAVRADLGSDVPAVQGDRIQLQQVVLNLIMNAIDAMTQVTERRRELLIRTARNSGDVLIQVQDSGKGLDAGRERIFEPFFSTKPEGIGLGLSISRSIIEAHGGRLWAGPGSPHGAVFQFSLPQAESGR